MINELRRSVSVVEFGAIGTGVDDDTWAFERAVSYLEQVGGGQLIIPNIANHHQQQQQQQQQHPKQEKGNHDDLMPDTGPSATRTTTTTYLIRPINLTSNLVLFMEPNVTILAVDDATAWPVVSPWPSYGQGRDHPGPRYSSLLHGEYVTNVSLIGSGNSSVLHGNGNYWYELRRTRKDQFTRGHLIEFMYSKKIQIYNMRLQDSPMWNVHIYDCDNVHIRGMSIQAPFGSPNTDGWDPDSSRNVLIEDSQYTGGDDCVAIKSGWDCFGIDYGKPTVNITVRNITCNGNYSGGITIGSEMSGGIENVLIEHVTFPTAVNKPAEIKTGITRGGYIRNITFRDIFVLGTLQQPAIQMDMLRYSRPDAQNPSCPSHWAPATLPVVSNITFLRMYGLNATFVGQETFRMVALNSAPFQDIFLQDVYFPEPASSDGVGWNCSAVNGRCKEGSVLPWPPCAGFDIMRVPTKDTKSLFDTNRLGISPLIQLAAHKELRLPSSLTSVKNRDTFSVSSFGASGDGLSDDTSAFEQAIEWIHQRGGGRLLVPGGGLTYRIRPINLTSNLILYIQDGAIISGIANASAWPIIPGLPSYGQGRDRPGPRYTSLLHGEHLCNVTIAGDGMGSIIDGNGPYWYELHRQLKDQHTRGHLIEFMYSRNILVDNVQLRDSPFWFNHVFDCDDVIFRSVHIRAPEFSYNTDGWDPDSSRNVLIEDSTYEGGDDCVAIKSGWDCRGIDYAKPSINITIRNITCQGSLCAGIALGSEMSGGIENVLIEKIRFPGMVSKPINIKTSKTRGGFIRNVTIQDIEIEGTIQNAALYIDMVRYSSDRGSANPLCPSNWEPALPQISDIHFRRIRGSKASYWLGNETVYHFLSLEGSPILNISLHNVTFDPPQGVVGWNCSFVSGVVHNQTVVPWPPCPELQVVSEQPSWQMSSQWNGPYRGTGFELRWDFGPSSAALSVAALLIFRCLRPKKLAGSK